MWEVRSELIILYVGMALCFFQRDPEVGRWKNVLWDFPDRTRGWVRSSHYLWSHRARIPVVAGDNNEKLLKLLQ